MRVIVRVVTIGSGAAFGLVCEGVQALGIAMHEASVSTRSGFDRPVIGGFPCGDGGGARFGAKDGGIAIGFGTG